MPRINLPGSGHVAPPPVRHWQWLQFTDMNYLAAVQRAFAIIDGRVKGHAPCNAAFKALPAGRTFAELCHWTIVATLVHELAHIGGAGRENQDAENTLKACLMRAHFNPDVIGSLESARRFNGSLLA